MNNADKDFVNMVKEITEVKGEVGLIQKTTANHIGEINRRLESIQQDFKIRHDQERQERTKLETEIKNVLALTIKSELQTHQIGILNSNQAHNLEIDNKINIFKEGLNDVKTEITIAKRLARMIGVIATGTGAFLGTIIGWFLK